jgi:hypothetical protein
MVQLSLVASHFVVPKLLSVHAMNYPQEQQMGHLRELV